MKKLLVSLLCAVMMVTFMPSMAFADTGGDTATPGEHVAEISGTKYETLNKAIENVKSGETINILKNIDNATGISVQENKNFTIDFQNHEYVLTGPGAGSQNTETNGFQLLKDSTITFKNGTIRIGENPNNIKRIIQNYADLTLENVQIYAKNQVGGENLALSINYGRVIFKGNTSVHTTSNDIIAFDICKFGSYPSAKVTFDNDYTGTINGKILYDAKDAETHTLTINGNGNYGGIVLSKEANPEAAKSAIKVSGGTISVGDAKNLKEVMGYLQNGNNANLKLTQDIVVSDNELPFEVNKNTAIDGQGNTIKSTDPSQKLSKMLFALKANNTLELKNAIVSGINTSSSIVYFNPLSHLKTEGNVAFTNNTATTVLASGGNSANTVTVNGTLNISNNTANGMNGGKLVVNDGSKVIANNNERNGIAGIVKASGNASITANGNGQRGLTLYGESNLQGNSVVEATGNGKKHNGYDVEINTNNNVVTVADNASIVADKMAGHDGSELAKGRDKVVVVNGSGVVIEVKQPVTGEVGEENTTEALFNKNGESADTRENGVVILGKEGTVHGTVSGQIDLPAGVTVTVPNDANASGATFDAPAGTTVKNESNQPVKVDTPNGEVIVVPGETVESKPYEPPYIPPTTPVQKPTIEAEEGATVTLSKDGTTATIVVDKDATLKDVLLNGKSLGAVTEVPNLKTGDKLVVIVETAAEKNARIKAGVENTTIKMYYNKKEIGKGWIKLRYKKSYGYKVDNYEIFRSAKKKTNFGDEAWFVTKTNKTKGFYKNGKSVKKGTRYYYKMRGVREIAGETVYTQWSNIVMRTGR